MEMNKPVQINRSFLFAQIGIGAVAAAVTIALAFLIPGLIEQRSQLKSEVVELQQRAEELGATIDNRVETIAQLEKKEATAREKLLKAEAEAEKAIAAAELALARIEENQYDLAQQVLEQETEAAAKPALKPRVYIHIREPEQKKTADYLSRALENAEVTAPGTEVLVDRGPRTTEFRYFRESERAEAERILDVLRNSDSEIEWSAAPTYVSGFEDSKGIRPNHFELWLSAQT